MPLFHVQEHIPLPMELQVSDEGVRRVLMRRDEGCEDEGEGDEVEMERGW